MILVPQGCVELCTGLLCLVVFLSRTGSGGGQHRLCSVVKQPYPGTSGRDAQGSVSVVVCQRRYAAGQRGRGSNLECSGA